MFMSFRPPKYLQTAEQEHSAHSRFRCQRHMKTPDQGYRNRHNTDVTNEIQNRRCDVKLLDLDAAMSLHGWIPPEIDWRAMKQAGKEKADTGPDAKQSDGIR